MKRGKQYRNVAGLIEAGRQYSVSEAVEILKKRECKFDQTVEIHMNLGVDPKHSDQVVRGTVVLPHGTGRTVRVLVFAKGELEAQAKAAGADYVGAEELGEKIQGGWFDFDAVVATPDMMPLVGRLARILGPRGLMPSPKNGTVTAAPANVVKELKAGKISYRVDKGANVHAPVGKLSFATEALSENVMSVVESVRRARPASAKGVYIKSLVLTATMAPAVPLDMSLTR
ncbi:MAG: 50S ribosomal protein L1 [Fibrobacterales bacterium]|nr:50S ribosomal protein L1 [Fibrobacterales bacterium]MBP5351964.1 50S ribosomal protein L1 [Fibrobacterales bacterium]